MNKYEEAYSYVMMVQNELTPNLSDGDVPDLLDYKKVKARAATYILQEYLAGRITEMGETPE